MRTLLYFIIQCKRIVKAARDFEKLFEYKLETFEIPEIKESKNRLLKSKLRRSKSIPEVNLYAILLVQEALDEGTK